LHIGISKTGTTSLQEFLVTNRLVLAKKGILYPTSLGKRNTYKLAHYVLDFHKLFFLKKIFWRLLPKRPKARLISRRSVITGLISKERVEDFRKELLTSFQKEIQNTNCTKLLISAEGFSANWFKVKDIRFLKKFLDDFVNEYAIIVYFRPQHEKAISGHSTGLREGRLRRRFFPKRRRKTYNYEKILEDWANVFGNENIVPEIFSRKELLDGDIKKDFVSLMGWNWNDFEDVKSRNQTMNADAQKFVLQINRAIPRIIGNEVNENRGNIGVYVHSHFKGKGLQPTRRDAENFFKLFKDSNEKVRQKWFPEKKELFEVDFDKYPEKKESFDGNFEKDYAFAFEVFAKLLSEKQKRIHNRKEQLKDETYLQEQISIQQSKFDQLILNREHNEKQIISKKEYIHAFEVFAKLWSEKLEEIRTLGEN